MPTVLIQEDHFLKIVPVIIDPAAHPSQHRTPALVLEQFRWVTPRSAMYDCAGRGSMDVTSDWFWEGNVVEAIARFLVQDGWAIKAKANTHSKERGVDIHATRNGLTLLIEAKGYPAKTYRDPRRAGELKPTNPTNQAQQWYSHALLKVMRLQTKHPGAVVALGFPDFPRYRALFEETHSGLAKLGVAMLTVRSDGQVETWGLHGKE